MLGCVWKPRDYLQKKFFLGLSCVSVTNGPFIDGRTTGIEPARGGFTIHCLDPLGYIRPYPPHRFKSLSTIRPFPPYDRYQREAFSYTIVASLLLCFGIRGRKASTSRSFLEKLQTKRLGCSLHWFDFTLLKIKDRGRAGSEGSFSRQQASSKLRLWRAASTYSYQNEKQQAPLEEASPFQRKPLRASPLYRVPNLRTPKLQQALKPLLILFILCDIFRSPFLQNKPFYNIREALRAFFACLSASFPFLLVRFSN